MCSIGSTAITVFFLAILAVLVPISVGLKCYTCSVGEQDLDKRCVTDPASVVNGAPITNCDKKYCTSIRQDFIEPRGKVVSMSRGCEDKPVFLNEIFEDATYRFYYRACREDLCNDGSGYNTGSNTIQDQDEGGIIYTKGIGDNASTLQLDIVLFVITAVTICFVDFATS